MLPEHAVLREGLIALTTSKGENPVSSSRVCVHYRPMTVRNVTLQVVACSIGLLAVRAFVRSLVAMSNNMADKVCFAGEPSMAVRTLENSIESFRRRTNV